MNVVDPVDITESNFIESTIAEPDHLTGEVEWASIPNDGYSLAAEGGSPAKIVSRTNNDEYWIWDFSEEEIRIYDGFFNYKSRRSTVNAATSGYNGVTLSTMVSIVLDADWSIYSSSSTSDTKILNSKPYFLAAGITTLDPVGMFFARDSNFDQCWYILNKRGVNDYVVIKLNSDDGVVYENFIDVSVHGTPRDITYRNGEYKILFSDTEKTVIAIYDETFSVPLSGHEITGNTIDQPYDSFTAKLDGLGHELLKTSTLRVYNVDANYNHGSSYKPGDQVVKSLIHKKYQCLKETVQDPEIGVDEVPPAWLELGSTNRWAMFEGAITYQSRIVDGFAEIELRPVGQISSINIFNMENVDSIEITTSVPDIGARHSETYDVTGKNDLVVYDFPPFTNPYVFVKFFGGDMKVGEVVVGEPKSLGTLLAGAVSDRIDYSRYTYDEFGELTYVPRPIVNYTTYPIRVAKIDALGIERYLDNLKGKQAVWIGNIGDGQNLVTRGTIERSPMTYDTPSVLEYLIKVRGSI